MHSSNHSPTFTSSRHPKLLPENSPANIRCLIPHVPSKSGRMYQVPVKSIHSQADFAHFEKSHAITEILDYVKKCAESVVGVPNVHDEGEGEGPVVSVAVAAFVAFMTRLFVLVTEVPPIKQPMRFGNKAFRIWHEKMVEESKVFLTTLLEPLGRSEASIELAPYIAEMFGNPTRIDYGTGHELNFAILFLLLTKLGAISDSKADLSAIVTKGFVAYVRTMRKLQIEYMLEPAGSHGVWGLDDYHCLLFLWGAAQLSNQKEITPSGIHNAELLKEHSSEYIYFEGIRFIKHIKSSAPFAETSPMLNDISALHDWGKICSGLMRLFQAEVLNKFPVIQHLLFGSLLRADWLDAPTVTHAAAHTQEQIRPPTSEHVRAHVSPHHHVHMHGSAHPHVAMARGDQTQSPASGSVSAEVSGGDSAPVESDGSAR